MYSFIVKFVARNAVNKYPIISILFLLTISLHTVNKAYLLSYLLTLPAIKIEVAPVKLVILSSYHQRATEALVFHCRNAVLQKMAYFDWDLEPCGNILKLRQ